MLNAAGFATTPAQRGSRLTPAGERLEWTVFKLGGDAIPLAGNAIATAPFFIQWGEGTRHPSTTAPGGCVLERLLIQEPLESGRLRALLELLGVMDVTVEDGNGRIEPGDSRIEAQISCDGRRARITTM